MTARVISELYYKTLSRTGKWFTPSAMSVLASELQAIILHTFWLDFYWKLHFFQMLVTKGTKNPPESNLFKVYSKIIFFYSWIEKVSLNKNKKKIDFSETVS